MTQDETQRDTVTPSTIDPLTIVIDWLIDYWLDQARQEDDDDRG
jgi:hypothetical protein